jgi:hypothetical protein
MAGFAQSARYPGHPADSLCGARHCGGRGARWLGALSAPQWALIISARKPMNGTCYIKRQMLLRGRLERLPTTIETNSMTELASETEFASYLDAQGLVYKREYHVGPGNFDFRIESHSGPLYCDVKEIRDSDRVSLEEGGPISSYLLLRDDIRRLRRKYKGKKLDGPVVLVTMNFSSNFFTGFTVANALLGDIGVILRRERVGMTTPLHHLPRGNAVFTQAHNKSVAGVFVFDRVAGGHVFFRNPYADPQMPNDVFPGLRFISLSREAINDELVNLGNMMFWPVF